MNDYFMLHKGEYSTVCMHILLYAYHTIIQKNARKPKTPPLARPFTPAQLLRFFVQLLPRRALLNLPALKGKGFYHRLFNPLVTLWYLLFQRLNADHTLEAALADARAGGGDQINKKLSRQLVSDSTCSYSDARQRLPWKFLLEVLCLQAGKIIGLSPTTLWHGLSIALLDGSTIRLRPHGTMAKEFPAQRNQYPNRAYWCLMRVVVCFCALSGAALDCVLGSIQISEQVMACQIILQAAARCLFIGDRNFGVFRIVQAARHAGQEVLLRLTERRARRLLGRALQVGQYEVHWHPSGQDQLQQRCSPVSLSFSSVRRCLEAWLRQFRRTEGHVLQRWTKALQRMAHCRLPRRRKARPNEPRAQRHLRLPYKALYGSRANARR